KTGGSNSFWPIWPIIGWGIGLAFSYLDAYESNNFFSTQKEYETLKNQQ
ncbi:MAG: 2TM domain-containing protein, partial [Chitinophagaceae bacterium]|nr:2TM domain-containing protein [Chitinophagaceae bacterium]